MSKFQRELILATAKEFKLRAYDYDRYVLVLDTMGEELTCSSVKQLLEWIGE